MGDVGDFDPGGFELVADAVGLGKVFGLFRVLAGLNLRFDLRGRLAGFGEDGERPGCKLLLW